MERSSYNPKIKLCGIRRIEDLDAITKGSIPDYIGFVFAKSKRQVSIEEAKVISKVIKSAYPQIQLVGVFVNEEMACIEQIVNELELDIIQLHGDEENNYIEQIKKRLPNTRVWKALRIREERDYEKVRDIKCDQILLDAYQEGNYGGTGTSISLDLLKTYEKDKNRSYMLAGGIKSEHITSIAENISPYGLDISSGIETEGYKDSEKIKTIIRLIREETKWELKEDLESSEDNMFQRL